jgi:hypothetical protein
MKFSIQIASRLPRWPWWAVLIVAVWGGLVLTAVCLSRWTGVDVPLCPLKHFTGLPCPTCGGTRGVLALADGRVHDAFLFNPLLFAAMVAAAVDLLGRAIFARRLRLDASPRQRTAMWIALIVLVLLNWAYLIARGV